MKKYENLAKAIYDIGKYAFTVLVIGQFISARFNILVSVAGVVFTLLMFAIAVKLEKIKTNDNI